ncbi:hypothetical protein CFC21_013139 [Triticum aestivum]|uniref:TF-B3 domain-containing protein n=2 Tax=Triticum aestivum TaxID=4565 RepID=A0A3B6A0F6_WHEAT|nr:hypothetical protein CFC21_013139 [Triticum aestivum]
MAQRMMSTAIAPFTGLGISVFNSVALMSTASDSFYMSGMEPKFEHTSMLFSNLVRSTADHPRKKALQPIPQGKGLALELKLELMAMERRKVDSEKREGIGESNEMGMEVLPAVDKKGKEPVHPMPEVVLPPTDDERMEEPPSSKRRNYNHYHEEGGPTHFCKVILAPKLECIPMPLDFTKHFAAVPTEFKLRNNTGCFWRVMVKLMNGSIGYMVTFRLLTPDTLKVIIFDDDGIEVVNKCGKHDEAFVARD